MKKYLFLILHRGLTIVFMHASFTGNAPGQSRIGEDFIFRSNTFERQTISCASCHKPRFAFADTALVRLGVGGSKRDRGILRLL